jgi:hypothetical protein
MSWRLRFAVRREGLRRLWLPGPEVVGATSGMLPGIIIETLVRGATVWSRRGRAAVGVGVTE